MAIETGAYSYLFDPIFQVEGIAGKPCVGGHIEVYKSGTDEKVITLSDWDGTVNPFKIPLGSDGRAVILVDIGYTYDAYIYDSFNNLICSRLNIIPLSNGDVTVQGLSQVYHDSTTLSGKGTPDSPLTVIGGSGGLSTVITQWPVVGNGSEEDPVTINDLTLLATDGTMTAYNAEVEGSNAIVLGVNGEWFNQATTGFQTKSDMNNYVTNNTLITQVNTLNNKITNNSNAITATNAEVDKKLYTSAFNNEITAYAKITDVESQLATKQDKLTDYDPNTWNTVTAKLNTSDFESVSGDFALKSEIIDSYSKTESDDKFVSKHAYDADTYKGTEIQDTHIHIWNGDPEWTQGNGVKITNQNLKYFANIGMGDNAPITTLDSNGLTSKIAGGTGNLFGADVGLQGIKYTLADGTVHDLTNKANTEDIPTKTSELENDSGFLTEHQSLEGYATENFVTNITDNKLDTSAFDTAITAYALKSDIPTVPTNVGAFTNDVGYLTEHQDISMKLDTSVFNDEITAYALKSELPVVPTNVGAFTNDVGYLTEHQSLDGYATESWVENKNYLVSDDISGKADKTQLSNYYPITGGNLNGKLVASGTGSAASAQAAVIYAKVTNTSTNNQAGFGTNGSVWAGDYSNATSQTIGVRRKVGDKKLAGRFQLYSDGNVSFQQIENNDSDSIVCQLQYGNTTNGNNWGTMTFGDETKHIAYTEDIVLPVIGTIEV